MVTKVLENLACVPRILVVEDNESLQKLVASTLTSLNLRCDVSANLADARSRMSESRYDLLVVDLGLPDGSGLSLMSGKEQGPRAIVMTGNNDVSSAIQAIRHGAIDFIPKPFTLAEFTSRITCAVDEWRARAPLRDHVRTLQELVRTKSEEWSPSLAAEDVYDKTVLALVAALNLKDHETANHCARVSKNSVTLGALMHLPTHDLKILEWGAYLHDVGKIGIPEQILLKPGKLDAEERRTMEKHPVLGYDLIRTIEFLERATEVVLSHHERFDGSGYPFGLAGSDIPLSARIFALMDALDALTADRPYHGAISTFAAADEIGSEAGTQFDPQIVEAFLSAPLFSWQVQEDAPAAPQTGSNSRGIPFST